MVAKKWWPPFRKQRVKQEWTRDRKKIKPKEWIPENDNTHFKEQLPKNGYQRMETTPTRKRMEKNVGKRMELI